MNYTTAVFLINKNVRAVMCNYEPDAEHKTTMFKTLDTAIRVGDFVIVPTKTRHGMTVSKIVEVDVDVLSWLVATNAAAALGTSGLMGAGSANTAVFLRVARCCPAAVKNPHRHSR